MKADAIRFDIEDNDAIAAFPLGHDVIRVELAHQPDVVVWFPERKAIQLRDALTVALESPRGVRT